MGGVPGARLPAALRRASESAGSDTEQRFLERVYDAHAPALWSYALNLTRGDRRRAEDIVQETMLRAWRTPALLSDEHRSPRPWLYAVARRISIDEWRSRSARPEVVTDALPERSSSDESDATLQSWLVADALGRLSAQHREVIVACYFQDRSVNDAAALLGVPAGTIKSRSHYALRALRLALQEMGVLTP
ncbi:MAG: sigma-70 family RNA polymerase sigma factor [Mycobacteriales bacterium]